MDDLDFVLRLTGGAFRVPLATAAVILGIAARTIYNRRRKGTWPLNAIEDGGRIYFRADDVARLLGNTSAARRPKGRPTKAEQIKAEAAGLSVRELRGAEAAK